ncbi:MAG: hypothetical protein FH749_04210 [Firmicutes bacterium]|nr:hypothetical protein [Bacillota bacterium]
MKIKMVLLCAMGMSSSMIVKSILSASEPRGLEIELPSHPVVHYKELDYSDVDLILLAPQVRNQKSEIETYCEGVPVVQIGMREYGLIKGEEILEQALKELKK